MKHIVLDFDDGSFLNYRYDLLAELKEHFPKLKVSLFFIPFDARYESNAVYRMFRKESIENLKKNLDWIQIIPHGLTHMEREFKKADKQSMRLTLKAIDEIFRKEGIPYEKGFKAPYWQWNQDVVDVLDKKGWWGAIDTRNTAMIRTKKFYKNFYSCNEQFWLSDRDVIKIHGHMDGKSDNDVEKCFMAFMKIPTDAEFNFVTDYLEDRE